MSITSVSICMDNYRDFCVTFDGQLKPSASLYMNVRIDFCVTIYGQLETSVLLFMDNYWDFYMSLHMDNYKDFCVTMYGQLQRLLCYMYGQMHVLLWHYRWTTVTIHTYLIKFIHIYLFDNLYIYSIFWIIYGFFLSYYVKKHCFFFTWRDLLYYVSVVSLVKLAIIGFTLLNS